RCVYVHCRAGIGRTGMVVGCFLVEHGLAGEAALEELNRLWQHCERSQIWGSVPETDEQTAYVRSWKTRGVFEERWPAAPAVRVGGALTPVPAVAADLTTSNAADDWDPLLGPEALSAARSLRERFLGALLGLATGDAVAAATQYRRPGTFTPVGDMLGGGPFDLPRGGWSDDTSMALCLAESLLQSHGFDARDQIERYRRWQEEGYLSATGQCVGITASTARAIAMAQWRRQAFSGSHDPAQLDPEPLSRVAPAVLFFFASSDQAIDQATEAARTTCQAPLVLDACRSLARALHAALSGQPKAVVLERAALAVASRTVRTGAGAEASARGVAVTRAGSSAPAVLAAAVAAFGATGNFRDAVVYAANLGGHSDVIAAVCGQLAGAYYGVKGIPTSWHNSLMQKELITSCADRLLAHAMLGLGG
ncbi:MAG: ADP-ribosylglycohydrolase family protein, partial [Steroidobacteraceae bacterium]